MGSGPAASIFSHPHRDYLMASDQPGDSPFDAPVGDPPVADSTNPPVADSTNPYASVPQLAPEPVLMAEAVSPPPPRAWTAFAIAGISLGVFLVGSLVMALVAIWVVHGEVTVALLRDEASFQTVSQSRIGLFILVVIPQFSLVAPTIIAALLSPRPARERLGLVRGHWPIWAWLAAAAATPLVGLMSGLITSLFMEESESLKQMSGIFREHGQQGFLIPLALMIGATPAICEELLFRGYIQTRLARSFGPAIGIIVASGLFAAFHLDFVHVVAVFPLGLFLGWLAWKSGSIFPAMLAHFVNNVLSVVAVVFAPEGQTDVLSLPTVAVSLMVISAGIVGMTAVVAASILYRRPLNSIPSAATDVAS